MSFSMLVLISSFESSIRAWMDEVLRGDLYLSPASGATLAFDLADELGALSETDRVDPVYLQEVMLPGLPGAVLVQGESLTQARESRIWLEAPPDDVALSAGQSRVDPIFISEVLSRRLHLSPGDPLELPTLRGPVTTVVAGVYAEYGNERGSLQAEAATVARWFGLQRPQRLVATLGESVDATAFAADLRASRPELEVRSNAELRSRILALFRQTFAVTYGLLAVGLGVAFGGLILALGAIWIEGREEFANLRKLGFSPGQLRRVLGAESAGIALAALVPGLALGGFLSLLLVYVINRQAFGWTLVLDPSVGPVALIGAALVASAAVAGFLIARPDQSLISR
jgi:putative ABC transport system permease protein